ncbi:MAG: hypothetical protein HYS25_12770 [Ignavibacteriales bacterium]|nr:hypothetical protein [Ignavibacteriales bacterium]
MGIAEGMKTLSENIVAANDRRARITNNLTADIQNMLNDLSTVRKKMSDDQKNALNIFTKNLFNKVKNLREKFQKERKHMGEAQAKGLSDFAKNLDKDVNSMINSFRKERGEKSNELKKKLTKEISNLKFHVKLLKSESENLMQEFRNDFKKAHHTWREMSVNLVKSRKAGLTSTSGTKEKGSRIEEFIERKRKKERKLPSFQEVME